MKTRVCLKYLWMIEGSIIRGRWGCFYLKHVGCLVSYNWLQSLMVNKKRVEDHNFSEILQKPCYRSQGKEWSKVTQRIIFTKNTDWSRSIASWTVAIIIKHFLDGLIPKNCFTYFFFMLTSEEILGHRSWEMHFQIKLAPKVTRIKFQVIWSIEAKLANIFMQHL